MAMALTPGNYLIRSALNEGLVLQTAGGSKNKGARIEAGYLTEADNRCYWTVANVSSEVKITNRNSGSGNGNLAASAVANGAAIVQNKYSIGTGAWTAVLSGNSMTVNGQTVSTYYLKAHANNDLYLTAPDNGGELFLSTALDDSTNQEFYFEASTYLDKKLATPNTIRTDDDKVYIIARGAASFCPQWKCSKSNTVYELRYRSRCYDMDGNLTGDWSAWIGWEPVTASAQLNAKKKYTGLMRCNASVPAQTVDNISCSRAEIQIEIRLTSAKNASGYNRNTIAHGVAASQIINHWCQPSLSISAAVYSPDGLALTYATDYTIAGSSITIDSIENTTTGETLIENYKFTGQDYIGELYLNCDELYGIPAANDTIRVTATITEENGVAKKKIAVTLTVAFDTSWGLTLNPIYTVTDRMTVQAEIDVYSTLQLFMERPQLDGTTRWVECDKISDNGETAVFEFAPPFGQIPNLMWVAVDTNANWTSLITEPSGATVDAEACSWFWIDEQGQPRAAILKYRAGEILSPVDSITLPANKFVTTGREYPVFRYAKSIERTLNIEGVILGSEAGLWCTLADFEALATANHCIFRQPDGKWYQVAITGIRFERNAGYTEVTVNQEAETR